MKSVQFTSQVGFANDVLSISSLSSVPVKHKIGTRSVRTTAFGVVTE